MPHTHDDPERGASEEHAHQQQDGWPARRGPTLGSEPRHASLTRSRLLERMVDRWSRVCRAVRRMGWTLRIGTYASAYAYTAALPGEPELARPPLQLRRSGEPEGRQTPMPDVCVGQRWANPKRPGSSLASGSARCAPERRGPTDPVGTTCPLVRTLSPGFLKRAEPGTVRNRQTSVCNICVKHYTHLTIPRHRKLQCGWELSVLRRAAG